MKVGPRQKTILIIYLCILALILILFPPWTVERDLGKGEVEIKSVQFSTDFHPLWSPPASKEGDIEARIDWLTLLLEILGLTLVLGFPFVFWAHKEPDIQPPRAES